MRVGIMAMQINSLVPPNGSRTGIASFVAAFDHAQLVRQLNSYGFNPIELGGDLAMFFPQAFSPLAVERLGALKRELGLVYTVHLPLWSVEPSTPLAPVREGSVQAIVNCIQATLPLSPEVYVLHSTGSLAAEFYHMELPGIARAILLQQFQDNACASAKAILDATGIPNRQIAVETIDFPLEMTLRMAEELDLSICFDTGHVLSGLCGDWDLFNALELCLPRLAEVHLHDAPRHEPLQSINYGKDHQRLGAGNLDVGRLMDRLADAGFNGPIILELTVPHALASLDVIRAVRPRVLQRAQPIQGTAEASTTRQMG